MENMLENRAKVEISMQSHLHRLSKCHQINQAVTLNATRQSIYFDEVANLIAARVYSCFCVVIIRVFKIIRDC